MIEPIHLVRMNSSRESQFLCLPDDRANLNGSLSSKPVGQQAGDDSP